MDDIRNNLCIQDRRHPQHFDIEWDHEPKPGGDCACDACFYGRHPLASEIIAHRRFVAEVERLAGLGCECDCNCLDDEPWAHSDDCDADPCFPCRMAAALTRLKKGVG